MYGTYLEIVHAISNGGYTFIKKAYSSIHNKLHVYRDVMDVVTGTSAVIVASVEPDKIGKVIDASSSVKELFGTTKQALIGSNVGVVLPNIVSAKHNDLIRGGHHKLLNEKNIQHSIVSYAKTLHDEYFRVQVTLHVSPLTHKGLNLVAYIRKMADYEPLMIIDMKGNIVEYSKDLGFTFNLFTKRGFLKIENLCPSFKKINHAFATIHNDDSEGNSGTVKQKILENENFVENNNMTSPLSPTNQRLFSGSMDNETMLFQPLRNPSERVHPADPTIAFPVLGSMSMEEAQEIWESYSRNVKDLSYFPSSDKNSEVKYKTEIEPFFFDKKWYKIVKIKNLNRSYHEKTDTREAANYIPKQNLVSIHDGFADEFPDDEEKTENDGGGQTTDSHRNLFTRRGGGQDTRRVIATQIITLAKQAYSNDLSSEDEENGNQNMKKLSNKSRSVITSQTSQKLTSQRVTDSLKIEKQSPSSKLVISMVYFAILVIIISICVHLIYTKRSLTEMQSSITLTQIVNTRLAKTIISWQAMLVLFSRAVQLRPIDYRVPQFQALAISSSLDVIENARELAEQLDRFQKKEIVEALYAKTVNFWDPRDNTLFNDHAIDQFNANQVLLSYYMEMGRYKGSYLNLNSSRKFLFSINNTANDYLITLDRSIHDLANFFTETKNMNVKLLKVITAIEILSVLSPLILLFVILTIVIKTYSKLFHAICKINDQSLSKRIKQLEDISKLFDENLEDDVSCFNKFKSQGFRSVPNFAPKKPISANYSRAFKIKNITVHLLKYITIAAVLIIIVIVLVAISLHRSIDDLEILQSINKKTVTVYSLSSQIRTLLPAFYFDIIFYNSTNYKIYNGAPSDALALHLETLDNSNNILLKTLVDSNNEISDPVIVDILNGDVCKYVSTEYIPNCLIGTKGRSYGLLGFNAYYAQTCTVMKDWINTPNQTFAQGSTASGVYSTRNNNTNFALFDAYDYITNYLVGSFLEAIEEDKNEMQSMFYQNLAAVLVSMFLIRVFVITKLQVFDLGIRRILRIIPYSIIEENKVMMVFLNKTFQEELKALKQLS